MGPISLSLVFLFLSSFIQPAVETVKDSIKEKKQHQMDASLPDLPEEIMYCGQKIDLTDEDVRAPLDREASVNV